MDLAITRYGFQKKSKSRVLEMPKILLFVNNDEYFYMIKIWLGEKSSVRIRGYFGLIYIGLSIGVTCNCVWHIFHKRSRIIIL